MFYFLSLSSVLFTKKIKNIYIYNIAEKRLNDEIERLTRENEHLRQGIVQLQNIDTRLQEHAENSVQNDERVDETRKTKSGKKNENQNTAKKKTLRKSGGINGKASFKYTAQ